MPSIEVDGLTFSFPSGWRVAKYDEWTYYRRYFSRLRNDIKAIDLLAIDTNRTAWLIEAKDYRRSRRTKPTDLVEEVRDKVISSIAGLMAAKFKANIRVESDMARRVTKSAQLRVVLHVEQPIRHSKLFPRPIKLADIQQKLKSALKCIDAHPRVVESIRMGTLSWTVR